MTGRRPSIVSRPSPRVLGRLRCGAHRRDCTHANRNAGDGNGYGWRALVRARSRARCAATRDAAGQDAGERATGIAERARGYLDRAPASGDVVERVSATVGGALSPAGASPSGRALAGGLGGLLASAGLRRRPGIGTVLGLAGLALLIGGVANRQSVSQR
jgi:hypothetical protein